MNKMWNLWHGCIKYSAGCQNCYVYMGDSKRGKDASKIEKTLNFDLPIQQKKNGEYKIPSGTFFYTCFTSDFFIKECDDLRIEAWKMIKERSDCHFLIITKRIERFEISLPTDWNDGYENVTICTTCENQEMVDKRLPIFKNLKIKHKMLIHEPILGPIDISKYLDSTIEEVIVGGESGFKARVCNYEWVLSLQEQCIKHNVSFTFKQTGYKFLKDSIIYTIPRNMQHKQAKEANINYIKK